MKIDQLKKKIIYRSNYRGTKEMDKLLSSFTTRYIDTLNEIDLVDLEKLLNIDDANLYNFYNGLKTEIEFEKHVKMGSVGWAHFDDVALDLSTDEFANFVSQIKLAKSAVKDETKTIKATEHHKYWKN